MTSERIEELRAEEERLLNLYEQAKKARIDAQIEASGVKIGDLVSFRGATYRVTAIEPLNWRKKPWLKGQRLRKDGKTFSKASHNVYSDWEKLEETAHICGD